MTGLPLWIVPLLDGSVERVQVHVHDFAQPHAETILVRAFG